MCRLLSNFDSDYPAIYSAPKIGKHTLPAGVTHSNLMKKCSKNISKFGLKTPPSFSLQTYL